MLIQQIPPHPKIATVSATRLVLRGERTLAILTTALEEVFRGTHKLNYYEILAFGRMTCATTRLSAWKNADTMSLQSLKQMAMQRARRYTTPSLLSLWMIDIFKDALERGDLTIRD